MYQTFGSGSDFGCGQNVKRYQISQPDILLIYLSV